MEQFGADLSGRNTVYIEANSRDELEIMFHELRLPYNVITIYKEGSRLIAWLSVTKALKKKIIRNKIKAKEK